MLFGGDPYGQIIQEEAKYQRADEADLIKSTTRPSAKVPHLTYNCEAVAGVRSVK